MNEEAIKSLEGLRQRIIEKSLSPEVRAKIKTIDDSITLLRGESVTVEIDHSNGEPVTIHEDGRITPIMPKMTDEKKDETLKRLEKDTQHSRVVNAAIDLIKKNGMAVWVSEIMEHIKRRHGETMEAQIVSGILGAETEKKNAVLRRVGRGYYDLKDKSNIKCATCGKVGGHYSNCQLKYRELGEGRA